jgi:nitrogen fixation/metabolism regulation signal transduction histidine kinase
LHNLLQNAFDATTSAGRADGQHPVVLKTEWRDANRRVRLSIQDCGTGFPDHILKRAFEPYVTTKDKGTGLGLAVVKKIADEHGTVGWKSATGRQRVCCAALRYRYHSPLSVAR